MWEQAPGHTLTNPSLLPSLCVRCVSTRALCIFHGLPDGSRVFVQASLYLVLAKNGAVSLTEHFCSWLEPQTPADTHASCTSTYNLHTILRTHVHADTQTHVPVSCADVGRRCCFISRASSLQCPRFPADCRISPRHQRTGFSSWSQTKHACLHGLTLLGCFSNLHLFVLYILLSSVLGSEWQHLSSCFSWLLCGPCGIVPKLWRRQGLPCMKCWWAGWASAGHSLLNRWQVNIYSTTRVSKSVLSWLFHLSHRSICIPTSLFG